MGVNSLLTFLGATYTKSMCVCVSVWQGVVQTDGGMKRVKRN